MSPRGHGWPPDRRRHRPAILPRARQRRGGAAKADLAGNGTDRVASASGRVSSIKRATVGHGMHPNSAAPGQGLGKACDIQAR